MSYLKKLSSLKEMATCQVAINLCQDNSFKEIAMCLEKPIYGTFINGFPYRGTFFISDPLSLLKWKRMKEAYRKQNVHSCRALFYDVCLVNDEKLECWNAAVHEQCQRLTECLPRSLKHGVQIWITRIALEYSSFSRRMELLFKVPRYLWMNILTRQDWTEVGRLNEKKLVRKLVRDEILPILQRYRIACVYCLHLNIPCLWNMLSPEEKLSISGKDDPKDSQEKDPFVLLWSYYIDGHRDEKVTGQKNYLWTYAAQQAVRYGNQAALLQCWKRLDKRAKNHIVVSRALQTINVWKRIQNSDRWCEKLISNNYHQVPKRSDIIEHFNLPSYYTELVRFFLSKMNEKKQKKFFEIAFKKTEDEDENGTFFAIDCFLDWPFLDYFLPMMNNLWETIPKTQYESYLLSLVTRYNGEDYNYSLSSMFFFKNKKSIENYDYQSLLWKLWEDTPEDYKQYVFYHTKQNWHGDSEPPVLEYLLEKLLTQSALQKEDNALFKRIWQDVPQDVKASLIYGKHEGNICSILVEKEMWSFINSLLKGCLTDIEIATFKKKFAELSWSRMQCFNKLLKNQEAFVEGFVDWSFVSDADKIQFKFEMIKECGLSHCTDLLFQGEYTELERVIKFCLSSSEMAEQFKIGVVKNRKKIIKNIKEAKDWLSYLTSELPRKEVQQKIPKNANFLKSKGQKRSLVKEDGSCSSRKRFKQTTLDALNFFIHTRDSSSS